MEWTEVNIYTTTEGIELLCSKLEDIGIKGFSIKDPEDFKEFLENKNGQWDYIDDDLMGLSECETCITVYIPSNGQGAEMLIAIKSMLAEMKAADTDGTYGRLEAEMSSIREEDWANNWKQYFKPFKVGEKLVIKPSWEDYDNSDGRIILEIDPASSFGTGKHHTTRLCLEVLEKYLNKGDKLLDMG
ncbi:MAG: 50S ribosomal protein L11 methyltransferase, partial [Ruminococcus sp.]|nr:50S ribosomal protein L11 methyltransferase [Ruminococcus sp.]